MKAKIIGSSSKGNAYLLESEEDALLIECGVKFESIVEAVNFNIGKINACLITHEHGDHCLASKKIEGCGINIISGRKTLDYLGIKGTPIISGQRIGVKNFNIIAFNVQHNAVEPFGFIVTHPEMGNLLFVTDTNVLKYEIPIKFNHIFIEANYCEKLRESKLEKYGRDFVEKRRINTHMSLQTAHLTLSKMDLSECRNIVLIHLSDGSTDSKRFKEETEQKFGVPVTIADNGIEVNLSLNQF